MAHIRTWEELQARELTPAEKQLIEACKKGERCSLVDGKLPPKGKPDPNRHINADVLRYLILGGCAKYSVDDVGVSVRGAHITGKLVLDFTTTHGATRMPNCRFEDRFDCEQTKCTQLNLSGSSLHGVHGQSLKVSGSIYLQDITTDRMIAFHSVIIGGQLNCQYAKFLMKSGAALIASNSKINGHALFDNITTQGLIALNGAVIDGQLAFTFATFDVKENTALFAQGVTIKQGLFWRNVNVLAGEFTFNSAHLGLLADDEKSWPDETYFNFDCMSYDRIASAATDPKMRLRWVHKGAWSNGKFFPQPYTQLAKVLREMGQDKDARLILAKREEMLRREERNRHLRLPNPSDRNYGTAIIYDLYAVWHWLFVEKAFGLLLGHGHKPFRIIFWVIILLVAAVIPAKMVWIEGSFAPNSAVIQNSIEWKLTDRSEEKPANVWSGETEPTDWEPPTEDAKWKHHAPGQDWETFSAFAYGLDVVIPIINFGQTEAWAPSTNRGWWGKQLYWMRWVLGALGWIVTALGAAAITGVIRRD